MFLYSKSGTPINDQAESAVAISATDATATIYSPTGRIYVGYAGTVCLIPATADATVNTTKVSIYSPAGVVLPILVQRIVATGTTATGFILLY